MNSLPSKTHVTTPPRGDHGARCSVHSIASDETIEDLPNVPSRFVPTSQSLSSYTTGDPPATDGIAAEVFIHSFPSAVDQISRFESGSISVSPSITPPPMKKIRPLKSN